MASPTAANWVAEYTNTIGIGPLVLTGTTVGNTTFANSVDAGPVWYAVKDGDNSEAGYGTFDGINIIERTEIHAVLVDGLYNDINPSPLTLTGSGTVQCTFNSKPFRELIAHMSISGNPHNTQAIQLPYDSSGDVHSTSNNVQNALADHSNAITATNSSIGDNTDRLDQHETAIANNISNIANNSSDIQTNTGNIATNTNNISTNTSNIATNTSNISSNTSAIAGKASQTSLDNTNANVATNSTNINTNVSDINANTALIDANTTLINTKEDDLGNPTTDNYILASLIDGSRFWKVDDGGVSTDVLWGSILGTLSDQTDLQDELDILTSSTSSNASNISTNSFDISTNTSNISTNSFDISTNTTDIATNTGDISSNTSNINTNTTDIATNTGNISSNTSNISTNTTDISDLQTGKEDWLNYPQGNGQVLQSLTNGTRSWTTISALGPDVNVDGGFANSDYLVSQVINGGGAV